MFNGEKSSGGEKYNQFLNSHSQKDQNIPKIKDHDYNDFYKNSNSYIKEFPNKNKSFKNNNLKNFYQTV